MYFYQYKALVWDDINKEEIFVHGITPGEYMSDALDNIEMYYGKDSLIRTTLASISDDYSVYEIEANNDDPNQLFKLAVLDQS